MTLFQFIERLQGLAKDYGNVPISFYDAKTDKFVAFTSALMTDDEHKEFLVFMSSVYVKRFNKISESNH